ncbi:MULTISPECIES: aminotransferase A [Metabacillus]|uniref:Aminotransferase n=2 Tax=Metabacillus TaxID=2675233 RepID=A0A179SXV9_9BACI|nr:MULTISPECIES: aminotransferase A [Metabacillus]OAS86656.1 aromatic amino acid aminotransferase [Metabacillus litoralis]QNF31029.1 aminotransferase A [Metabacillus sp. KUDC1714]
MEHLVNSRVKQIELSGIRKFFNMVADYEDVISLTIGQPDFDTPVHVKNAGIEAIQQNFTTYTHNAGFIQLREAASHFLFKKYGLTYSPENEVIVTVGASQAIDCTFRTLLEEGSEVILPSPVYPGYEPLIKLAGGTPVYVDTTTNQFKLTAELLAPYITEKTRCIVLPYPSNPTGVTLEEDELQEVAELVRDKNIFILSDEIYSELVYGKHHHSIARYLREQTIVINGLSKSHSMTGWRIGLLFAPEAVAKHILKVHQYNVSCATSISQKAAYEALTTGIDDATVMKDAYQERLEYVYTRLVKMGFEVVKPDGAFYLFPSIKKFNQSSFDFALSLVKNAGVALVPGSAFSEYGEGYVRLSYAYAMEQLIEAMDRIENYVKSL